MIDLFLEHLGGTGREDRNRHFLWLLVIFAILYFLLTLITLIVAYIVFSIIRWSNKILLYTIICISLSCIVNACCTLISIVWIINKKELGGGILLTVIMIPIMMNSLELTLGLN